MCVCRRGGGNVGKNSETVFLVLNVFYRGVQFLSEGIQLFISMVTVIYQEGVQFYQGKLNFIFLRMSIALVIFQKDRVRVIVVKFRNFS